MYLRNWACLVLCLLIFVSCEKKPELSDVPKEPQKVSVICPTYNRHEKHPFLYAVFNHQSYPNKELLILDDSASPSLFFTHLQDKRVTYIHIPLRLSIGAKRNMLSRMATGKLIAHFDDDDYYAPQYLETMITHLGNHDLVKLSKWTALREMDGSLWEWDTSVLSPLHLSVSGFTLETPVADFSSMSPEESANFSDKYKWGYGFSYLYTKSLWEKAPFPNINHGEDYEFITRARALGSSLVTFPDDDFLVLHLMHAKSTSWILPQRQITH